MIKDTHRTGPQLSKCLSDKILQPINSRTKKLKGVQYLFP